MKEFTKEHLEDALYGMRKYYLRGDDNMFLMFKESFEKIYAGAEKTIHTSLEQEFMDKIKSQYQIVKERGIVRFPNIADKLR
jgi:hypothetical protein